MKKKEYDVIFTPKHSKSGYEHFVLTRKQGQGFKTRAEAVREAKFKKKFQFVAGGKIYNSKGKGVTVGEVYKYKVRKLRDVA